MTHSQRRFLTQHIVSMLKQCWKHLKQCRNNVVTLCYAKNRRCESSRVASPWRTWTYYDEFPFVFLSLNKILKNSTPGKVESLKECKFIFLPSFSLLTSSSLLKVPNDHACGWRPGRREAGEAGALVFAPFVAKAQACATLIISEEKERLLAVFESMEEKNLSMNVISNNNKTENYHLTTFTFIFTFSNAINFLCFLNIGT